ncbi:beta-lactamase family protein [Bacillaceae bacterium SIJ1]|uniref:serine hydrolase domain-containing protein n=1 Tax=Litoribacterium kuwaitense TaxID=1398745 RepID=UPI0013E9C1E9|nr:serine hydrolase domain-containing protein [Litoribacterium kuwaitense]NGP45524.1 beta-lactamase family protein [Litoribacterium kuwaitense]
MIEGMGERPLTTSHHSRVRNIHKYLLDVTSKGQIPGAVIVIADEDTIYADAYGYRRIQPNKERMTMDTVFDLASLTKVVATLPAILLMIDKGIIDLHGFLSRYIEVENTSPLKKVTIFHLLTHTSGLSGSTYVRQYGKARQEMIEGVFKSPLENEPGSSVVYSNRGYIVLGELVRHVSEKPINQIVKKHIWEPIGMSDTCYNPAAEAYLKRVAPTEYKEELGKCLLGTVHDENAYLLGGVTGHSGVFSTAYDLIKFCKLIMSGGSFNGKQILSEELVKLSMVNHTSHLNEPRGLGWDFFSRLNRADAILGHLGFTGTSIWFDPANKTSCILLTNRIHPSRHNQHIKQVRRDVMACLFE